MVRAELLEEAEQLIEELLEWHAQYPVSDFAGMENLVLELRRRFGQRLAEALVEMQQTRQPVPEPHCAECGAAVVYKDLVAVTFESLLGSLTVQRGYYYCPGCQQGHYPLDAQLDLPARHWSAGVVRQIVWLSGQTQTYGTAAEVLCTLTDAHISKSSSWRLVQTWGPRIGAEIAAEEEQLKVSSLAKKGTRSKRELR
jgi:hypothetical protein